MNERNARFRAQMRVVMWYLGGGLLLALVAFLMFDLGQIAAAAGLLVLTIGVCRAAAGKIVAAVREYEGP